MNSLYELVAFLASRGVQSTHLKQHSDCYTLLIKVILTYLVSFRGNWRDSDVALTNHVQQDLSKSNNRTCNQKYNT